MTFPKREWPRIGSAWRSRPELTLQGKIELIWATAVAVPRSHSRRTEDCRRGMPSAHVEFPRRLSEPRSLPCLVDVGVPVTTEKTSPAGKKSHDSEENLSENILAKEPTESMARAVLRHAEQPQAHE